MFSHFMHEMGSNICILRIFIGRKSTKYGVQYKSNHIESLNVAVAGGVIMEKMIST